jgi:hypothetical protein
MRHASAKQKGQGFQLKSLLANAGIATATDALVFGVFLLFIRPTSDYLPVEHMLIFAVFVINICLAVATKYVIKKLYRVFLINSIVGSVIFHLLFFASLTW